MTTGKVERTVYGIVMPISKRHRGPPLFVACLAFALSACSDIDAEAAMGEEKPQFAVAELIDEAYMEAESCAKYGDEHISCQRLKKIEAKLVDDHNMCVSDLQTYVFEPCL